MCIAAAVDLSPEQRNALERMARARSETVTKLYGPPYYSEAEALLPLSNLFAQCRFANRSLINAGYFP